MGIKSPMRLVYFDIVNVLINKEHQWPTQPFLVNGVIKCQKCKCKPREFCPQSTTFNVMS